MLAAVLLATSIALPAFAAGPDAGRSVAAATVTSGATTDTTAQTNSASDITPQDKAQAKATADASVSFWKLAWEKSAPFFRAITVGLWDLLVRAWQDLSTGRSATATNDDVNAQRNAAPPSTQDNAAPSAGAAGASITPIPGPQFS